MPRAPHSMALLAGRPRAKRSVFSTRIVFWRSTPCSSPISTRETLGTGREMPLLRMPDEGVRAVEVERRRRGGRQPVQRVGDAGEQGVRRLVHQGLVHRGIRAKA